MGIMTISFSKLLVLQFPQNSLNHNLNDRNNALVGSRSQTKVTVPIFEK